MANEKKGGGRPPIQKKSGSSLKKAPERIRAAGRAREFKKGESFRGTKEAGKRPTSRQNVAGAPRKKGKNNALALQSTTQLLFILGAVILAGIFFIFLLTRSAQPKERQVLEASSAPLSSAPPDSSLPSEKKGIAKDSSQLDSSVGGKSVKESSGSVDSPKEEETSKAEKSSSQGESLPQKEKKTEKESKEEPTVLSVKTGNQGGKTDSKQQTFTLSPGLKYRFAYQPSAAILDTENGNGENDGAKSVSSAKEIPMVVTANVDGSQLQPNLQRRIQAAKQYNSDTVGWLRIRGTAINFAVVQNTTSNNYYTQKGYNKEYSNHPFGKKPKLYGDYGVIWASFDSQLQSREQLSDNVVLFGHNWENLSAKPRVDDPGDIMLEHIAAYAYTDFTKENPYINFSVDGEDLTWVVIGAFYTEDYWKKPKTGLNFDYFQASFTQEQKNQFISEVQKRSLFTTDDTPTAEDHFLTISTCTRAKGSRDDQRFVVIARLVRPDEELPQLDYQNNPSPKAPVFG